MEGLYGVRASTSPPYLGFKASMQATDTVTSNTVYADAAYEVDWGDGTWVSYAAGTASAVALGSGAIRVKVDVPAVPVTHFRLDTDTFTSLHITGGSNLTSANNMCSGNNNLVSFSIDSVSNVIDFTEAWLNCSSLTSFPDLTYTAGQQFDSAWQGCSSLTTFPASSFPAALDMQAAWRDCSSLNAFPLITNTNLVTNWTVSWFGCSSLTSFAAIDTSAGTIFNTTWYNCSSLTSFPSIDVSSSTNFYYAWGNCSGLTSFPSLTFTLGQEFDGAWSGCTSLTTFPALSFPAALDMQYAWNGCTGLTSFGAITNTNLVTNWTNTWRDCNNASFNTFPSIDVSGGTTFVYTWEGCTGLTSFPSLTFTAGQQFDHCWDGCNSLTTFPALSFPAALDMNNAWVNCTGFTSFGAITNTNLVTNWDSTWLGCNNASFTTFPSIDVSGGTIFTSTWRDCTGLTSFPNLTYTAGQQFDYCWNGCTNLNTFPASSFPAALDMQAAWNGCTGLTSFGAITNTNLVTNWVSAWEGCNNASFTTFPSIDVSGATNVSSAWKNCTGLTTFPNLTYTVCFGFAQSWYGCSGLTTFPASSFPAATSLYRAWFLCTGLTSFGAITNTNLVTTYASTWTGCSGLTSFPNIDVSGATTITGTWSSCTGLTSFPDLTYTAATNLNGAWNGCTGLTTFPTSSFPAADSLVSTWHNCSSLTEFPPITNTNLVTNWRSTWHSCSGLTTLPPIDMSGGTAFDETFRACSSLTYLPNLDTTGATIFTSMFSGCTNLECIAGIDTTSQTATAAMFTSCTSLVNPTSSEQTTITGVGGLDYTNTNPCPQSRQILTLDGSADYLSFNTTQALATSDTMTVEFTTTVSGTLQELIGGAVQFDASDLIQLTSCTCTIDGAGVTDNTSIAAYQDGQVHTIIITATGALNISNIGQSGSSTNWWSGDILTITSDIAAVGIRRWFNGDGSTTTDYPIGLSTGTNYITYNSIVSGDWEAFTYNDTDNRWEGVELVTNGTFDADTDWTKGTGWTIATNVASSDGTQGADALLTTSTVPTTVAGLYYVSSFEITAHTAGNAALQFDGTEVIADQSSTGTYTSVDAASDTTGTIDIVADLNLIASIDNVSLKRAILV